MVSYCVPGEAILSHEAFEPTNRWAATSSFPSLSSSPAGTQKWGVFLSGFGTGEPQREQKSERKPLSFTQDEMRSWPDSQRKFCAPTMVAVFDVEPPCLRQSEQ